MFTYLYVNNYIIIVGIFMAQVAELPKYLEGFLREHQTDHDKTKAKNALQSIVPDLDVMYEELLKVARKSVAAVKESRAIDEESTKPVRKIDRSGYGADASVLHKKHTKQTYARQHAVAVRDQNTDGDFRAAEELIKKMVEKSFNEHEVNKKKDFFGITPSSVAIHMRYSAIDQARGELEVGNERGGRGR